MKISQRIPEIYYDCQRVFGVNWEDGLAITYGDTVYAKYPLAPDVEVHEAVHVEQQLVIGPKIWWEKYLTDKAFRLSQEVPAYRAQMAYGMKFYHRQARKALEKRIILDMVTMYGDMCSEEEATSLIHS